MNLYVIQLQDRIIEYVGEAVFEEIMTDYFLDTENTEVLIFRMHSEFQKNDKSQSK